MYGDGGGKLPIRDMIDPIDITIERMRSKDPEMVLIPGTLISTKFQDRNNNVKYQNKSLLIHHIKNQTSL